MRSSLLAVLMPLAVAQPVPLPNTYDGFLIGSLVAPVQVEAFTDLLCPDCAADWATVRQLVPHYGDKVSFRLHVFPLPYHTYAFKAAMTAQVVRSLNGSDAGVIAFADLMYGSSSWNQQAFWNDAVAGNTSTQIEAMYAQAASTIGYSASAVLQGLQDPNMDEAARIAWKYATSRYTTGTPHYLINGLPVDDQLNNGALADWTALIDPLLAPSARKPSATLLLGRTRKSRSVC